jgi:hypothetical protein
VSPIFVRPVREQLEHDRLIRHLQARYQRKFEVAVNIGEEQVSPVKIGSATFFPDVVLTDGRKLAGLAEVETGESVNNLEAMAQWVHFCRARVPFHLYVPVHGYDAARRLLEANQAKVSEIWTYRPAAEGFDLVRMHAQAPVVRRAAAPAAEGARKARSAKSGPPPARANRAAKGTAPASSRTKSTAGHAKAASAAKVRPARSSDRLAAARKKPAASKGKSRGKKVSAGRRR